LDILRAQGYGVGTPDVHTGRVRVWIRGSEEVLDVDIGTELNELASGQLTVEEIRGRRDDEVTVWPD
jgi:hypothetical protein